MNTWNSQSKARRDKNLEFWEQNVRAKMTAQPGDTRGIVEAISNPFADRLLDLEENPKDELDSLVDKSHPMICSGQSSMESGSPSHGLSESDKI